MAIDTWDDLIVPFYKAGGAFQKVHEEGNVPTMQEHLECFSWWQRPLARAIYARRLEVLYQQANKPRGLG